jgi:DNA-binding LytR/AlgR family response regulator
LKARGAAMRARAIVADDEPALAQELCERVRAAWPELEIVAVVHGGAEALRSLEALRPDLLFLDIEMPGASGLDVARHASGRCHVVFVTAYDHYAVAAFDEGAVDYLRKPFSTARLQQAIARVQERLASPPRDLAEVLGSIAAQIAADRPYVRWLNAARGQETILVTVDDVVYFKAEDKYTLVMLAGSEALIRKTIKELAAELDPEMFWQIHRSTIVNAHEIAGVRRDFRGHMELRLKSRPETLHVAETYHHRFRLS